MNITDELLMAYADGELEGAERTAIEAAVARDPKLAERVAQHRALRSSLRKAYDPVLKEPVPERLLAALDGTRPATRTAQVLQFRPRVAAGAIPPVRPRKPWLQWGGIAASLVIGILGGLLAGNLGDRDAWVSGKKGSLVARGALAAALNTQLASNQLADAEIHMNVSFKSRDGRYCRAFTGNARQLAGLACRTGELWQLQTLDSAPMASTGGTYRQAASALPPAVLDRIQSQIQGDALDAGQEAAAVQRNWH